MIAVESEDTATPAKINVITGTAPPVSAAPFSLRRFAPKSGDKQLTAMGGHG